MAKKQTKKERPAESGDKLTIYEYEQKYSRRQNVRGAKIFLRIIAAAIGVFLFFCLFSVTMKVYEINAYAGYGTAGVSVILYIILFIVPLYKIMKSDYFVVNVNAYTARSAKAHNKKVRRNIADKIIDLTGKVEGVGWYDSAVVGRLAIAVKTNDENCIKRLLTELYGGSIKKSANSLIFKSALKSGAYSAVSQSNKIDAVLVAVINFQLVKDLVFLYGFRPSDAKLARIFGRVLQNSLIAYGLGGADIGGGIVRSIETVGSAVKKIPLLGTAISALVDSSVQGLTNGVLTTVIGYQTIKYLNEEYKLQDILDDVEIEETEEEFKQTCNELEQELKGNKKLQKAG